MDQQKRYEIREVVKFYYDTQSLRVPAGQRSSAAERRDQAKAQLADKGVRFLDNKKVELKRIEEETVKEVEKLLKDVPIWETWLKHQPGIGPTMAGVIVAYIDIERAETVSKLWRYSGLAVDTSTGKAERRKKGEKLAFNPWLKTRLLFVMGSNLIKAGAPTEELKLGMVKKDGTIAKVNRKARPASPWYEFYTNYKHRKASAGWGTNDAHRHIAAMRYMVKMFLAELYNQWRPLEGLSVRPPYAEEYLGKVHSG